MSKSKTSKHILKAAKNAVNDKFRQQIEALYRETADIEDEDRKIALSKQIEALEDQWEEWHQRAKKNKRKVGKRVEWTGQREAVVEKKIDYSALNDLRKTRRENRKPQVGISWLFEGALVNRRGRSEMMIVTQVRDDQVEVLHEGTTLWLRSLSVRPVDWMND